MSNLFSMLKQAKEMKAKMGEMKDQIALLEATGQAGGGCINIEISGTGLIKNIKIDDSLLNINEKEILEDLIIAAYADAKEKLNEMIAQKTQEITADLPIPSDLKSLL